MKKDKFLKKFLKNSVHTIDIYKEDLAYKLSFENGDEKHEYVGTDETTFDLFLDYLMIKVYNDKVDYVDIDDNSFNILTNNLTSINYKQNTTVSLNNYDNILSYFIKRAISDNEEKYDKYLSIDKIKNLNIFQMQGISTMYSKDNNRFDYNVSYELSEDELKSIINMIYKIVNKYSNKDNVIVEKDCYSLNDNTINSVKITIPKVNHVYDYENSRFDEVDDYITINVKGVKLINKLEEYYKNKKEKVLTLEGK